MKKLFLLFGFITFAALLTNAQEAADSGNGREKIKMLEIGYLTRQLQLSTQEAEKFWPLFNKYRQELRVAIRDKNINDELDRQQKVLDIRRKYRKDFSSILDEERGRRVYDSEDRFKTMVRKEMQQRMKMKQNGTVPQPKHK
ncbi:hypothetical protein [Agriterribacter sp.]|uniref:hypothetical protein n=1 Tax=Agriterribacter sp. TaxID=2821509 RepID=UPI002C44F7E5|nr:hypothetical protein [Agriterribacter sp.]HRO47462.1 hypothetical protein [Agriterribacter sp.]HRQ15881.1 hypothetical protein [Agriterribacter sp.]